MSRTRKRWSSWTFERVYRIYAQVAQVSFGGKHEAPRCPFASRVVVECRQTLYLILVTGVCL